MNILFEMEIPAAYGSLPSRIKLQREIIMPFIPPIGMTIAHGDWEAIVESLHWDASRGTMLLVHSNDDRELRLAEQSNRTPEHTLLEIVSRYLGYGWQLSDCSRQGFRMLESQSAEATKETP